MGRIRALIRKEFIELRQNPRLFGLVIIAPILQLTLLGYAATTDVQHVPVVVVDGDRSPLSRQLIERFSASPRFDVVAEETHPAAIDAYLQDQRAWLAVIVPAGLQVSVERQAAPAQRQIQVIADGTDANSSGVAVAYATGLIGDFNRAVTEERQGRPRVGTLEPQVRVWYNAELVSKDFMVPGVLALLLLVITANLSSMAIVREREVGTLEQLSVTPLGRWELILGKLLPYGLVGLVDVLLVVAVAVLWFEVPLRGNLLVLFAGCISYLLCTLGLGLFVSTISATQQQAMMTATFFFLVPMIYLSGFIFPIENMPPAIQAVTALIPLRYFLVIVRGVFLKGVGLDILWPQFAALTGWGITVLALAALRVRKRL